MAPKIVVLALALSICKVQSQSIGCVSNSQTSNIQSSSRPQTQTIQLQSSNTNKGLTASPQLQIVPSQNCNLQAIPLSQILSQVSNLQRSQSGGSTSSGCGQRQGIQVTSIPQNICLCSVIIPASTAQCNQQPSCPTVITAPVSTITIPPSGCTTIIDNSLSNSLANALQMKMANDFINSVVSNKVINADCLSIPAFETSVPTIDLSGILKGLNNQNQDCQSCGQSSSSSCQSDIPSGYDWKQLLDRLRDDSTIVAQTPCSDWSAVLSYLDSQNDKYEPTVQIEPESFNYDYSSFIDSLKQKGQTANQLSNRQSQSQTYNIQGCSSQNSDQESALLEALAAYLGCSPSQVSSNSYPSYPSFAEVVFPEEIPAQLICNYGYMPTTVPVVSFSVQPIGDTSNFIVGTQCQC